MSHAAEIRTQGIPRSISIGASALIAFALAATFFARNSGVGEVHMPSQQAYQVLHLDFVDADDGGVLVRDASNNDLLYRVKPGTNGFIRSALRGFAQERLRDGIGRAMPFTLTRWRDGTLSLMDEATNRRIDLDAFGPTQSEDFAQLFVAKGAAK
jgi:putative photosynthetic complex assembly protein